MRHIRIIMLDGEIKDFPEAYLSLIGDWVRVSTFANKKHSSVSYPSHRVRAVEEL